MAGSFQDELLSGLRSAWCQALEYGGNFLDALPDPLVDSGQVPIARLNRWLYRQFCNREPPPAPAPPFTGGQCPVAYVVTYTYTYDTRSIPPPNIVTDTTTMNFVYGYVRGLRIVRGTIHQVVIEGGTNGAPSTPQDYGGFSVAPGGGQGIISASIVSVARMDGFADDCGDPPPIIPPPAPGYNDIDINIEYSPVTGPNITIPVNFIFAPVRVNINGEAYVPIDIDVGGVDARINGEFNLNTGDITFNFGNRNYPPSNAPKPPDYRPDDDLPDNPPDVPNGFVPPSPTDPEPDTTRIIRAVIVTTSTVPNTVTTLLQDNNPDVLLPDLGLVSFAIAVGKGVAWTTDIRVKNKRQFIPCPWEGGALRVRGTPRPGVIWTITPVYLEVETPLPLFT